MSTKALKASNVAVIKSPVVKPNFHDLAKAGDLIVEWLDQLRMKIERLEAEDCQPAEIETAKALAADWQPYAAKIAKFNDAVEVYNRAGYDNYLDGDAEELSTRFIGEHIAKMIGSCVVAPHNPEMYARVMIEAIMEAQIKDGAVERAPIPLAIEAAFRQVIRQTSKSKFAPSLPVVLEALAKQQATWRKRIEYAECIEGWHDDLVKLLDKRDAAP